MVSEVNRPTSNLGALTPTWNHIKRSYRSHFMTKCGKSEVMTYEKRVGFDLWSLGLSWGFLWCVRVRRCSILGTYRHLLLSRNVLYANLVFLELSKKKDGLHEGSDEEGGDIKRFVVTFLSRSRLTRGCRGYSFPFTRQGFSLPINHSVTISSLWHVSTMMLYGVR
jgi:hypothetical protein